MSDVWDDTVLLKAFNSAISKYEDMHGSSKRRDLHENQTTLKESDNSFSINDNVLDGKTLGETKEVEVAGLAEVASVNSVLGREYFGEGEEGALAGQGQLNGDQKQEKMEGEAYVGTSGYASCSFSQWGPGSQTEDYQHHLRSQLQQVEQQYQELYQQLTMLNQPTQANAGTVDNGPMGSHYYPGSYTYPPCQASTTSCFPCCQWNIPSSTVAASSSPWPSVPFCSNCVVPSPLTVQKTAPSQAKRSSEAHGTLDELISTVREATSLAGKVAGLNVSSDVGVAEKGGPETSLSDVTLAWFMAGVQTAKYLASKNGTA